MSKLKETESIIEYIVKLKDTGIDIDPIKGNEIMLMDIARSLAMIVDKLHKDESEEEKND